jgi:dihydroflavonol-4-reductase
MRALVTGGTGFVGGAIVRELLSSAYSVRVLARASSRVSELERLGVEIARGDILDRSSIEAALPGCDVLFHAAAIYDLWAPDPDLMLRTEVAGTVNALEAALAQGTRRVVYTSTALTVGERRGEVGNEATAHRGYFLSVYERAKWEADRAAEEVARRGLDLVLVKPAGVMGPGDLKPTGRGIVNMLRGRFPMLFHGTLSGVDVEDVARVHVAAAEKGASGESYIASAWVMSVEEWLGTVCRIAGKRLPLFGPAFGARVFASLSEVVAKVGGTEPLLSVETHRLLTHGFRVSGAKSERELGIQYRTLTDCMSRAVDWYRKQGLIG